MRFESEVQSVIGSPELLAALQASFSQVRQPSNLTALVTVARTEALM